MEFILIVPLVYICLYLLCACTYTNSKNKHNFLLKLFCSRRNQNKQKKIFLLNFLLQFFFCCCCFVFLFWHKEVGVRHLKCNMIEEVLVNPIKKCFFFLVFDKCFVQLWLLNFIIRILLKIYEFESHTIILELSK